MEWENKKYVSLSWSTAILLSEDSWRLPTLAELEQAYRDNISDFHELTFWSSDERNSDTAYCFNFFTGRADYTTKETKYPIRLCKVGNNQKLFWEIRDLLKVQKKSIGDPYSLGLYNGIELCLALLEKREPVLLDLSKSESASIFPSEADNWIDSTESAYDMTLRLSK